MNWNSWVPWRSSDTDESEDSKTEGRVIAGDGPERVIINEGERTDDLDYEVTDD